MADYNSSHTGAEVDAAVVKAAKLDSLSSGDASKTVKVKSDYSGYEYVETVDITGVQTVAGVKTFSSSPIIPAPTIDLQAATKKYIDDLTNLIPQRSIFVYNSTTVLDIGPGVYFHVGTSTQRLYWDSTLNYTVSSLGVSDWSYIYLDDSAIVSAGTNVITTTQLTNSTTEPTWSDAKKGWYNGLDRCIFAVLTNGSSEILEFKHVGNLVTFADEIDVASGVSITTSWVDVSAFTMPSFSNRVLASIVIESSNQTRVRVRADGQTGDTGHEVGYVAAGVTKSFSQFTIATSSAHIIEIKKDQANTITYDMNQSGWYPPKGM